MFYSLPSLLRCVVYVWPCYVFSVGWLVVVGTRAAMTHDRYLHDSVVIDIWRHSPISFYNVSLWCLLFDSHRSTYQSNLEAHLRNWATYDQSTLDPPENARPQVTFHWLTSARLVDWWPSLLLHQSSIWYSSMTRFSAHNLYEKFYAEGIFTWFHKLHKHVVASFISLAYQHIEQNLKQDSISKSTLAHPSSLQVLTIVEVLDWNS